MKSRAVIGVWFLYFLVFSAAEATPAALKDKAQLIELLKRDHAITVIDGRGTRARVKKPIPFSLIPGEMSVDFAGTAIVIADNDQNALVLARQLSNSGKRQVFGVRGGYSTWVQAQAASQDAAPEDADPNMYEGFIIPSNTCEHDEALQVYEE